MKVLFVCHSNFGRSQMAMAFYNLRHPGQADSAGTVVDVPGQRLKERNWQSSVLEVMRELGIDMSENMRVQLTEDMVGHYDKVVVIAESAAIPAYLRQESHVVIWDDIENARGKSVPQAREIRDEIKRRVDKL